MSGYGTFSKQKTAPSTEARYGYFDTPGSNNCGQVSKNTKLVAQDVDNELLNDHEMLARIIEEDRENWLPDLSIDEANEMYLEVSRDLNKFLA
mmetsp:Transcript_16682/g.22512  ORF Transcript_16682/g.22512 Transcript_16682/m.22512 type:complete len:93 (-) Transcript_16682:618-896(-)